MGQVQDACGHTTVGHMFYHVLCPNQSLETRVTNIVFGCLLLIGGIFAISFIAKRFSTPASPKIPEGEQAATESVPQKKVNQDTESRPTQPNLHVTVGTLESWKHDFNDAGHLDKSMAGKKISDIQDIETVLRLFPKPRFCPFSEPRHKTSEWLNKKNAFSFVSNEVLSTLLENPIDDKDYLVEYFSTEQFHAIDIEKVPLSNLEKIFFVDCFFERDFYVQFDIDQQKIIQTRLKSFLKNYSGFEHLK